MSTCIASAMFSASASASASVVASASAVVSEEEDDTGGLLVGEVVFVFVLSICKASALCWGLVTIVLVTGFVSVLSICEASALC